MTDLTPKPRSATTDQGRPNVAEFSVSELANAIKRALEDGFGYVRLRGEVSGYRGAHSSGHCYFALKDDKSRIDAVIWKGVFGRLRIRPEEGMEVIATGKISSFPGSSKYQIVIEALEPAGLGALMVQLEERKKRLTAEGLFAAERKRALPFLPSVVGIVTSPTGAVIRDMLAGFTERFPTRVVVWPVRVQGEDSATEVANAIRGFNALAPGGAIPRPDVLIVARGGGSLEDLWGFNDEAVVRAVAESKLPVISAVGHETDWTLIDLAADARAPTPTKAAEWAVPKYADLKLQTSEFGKRLTLASKRLTETARQRFDNANGRIDLALRSFIERRKTQYAAARGRLPTLSRLLLGPRQRLDATSRGLGPALMSNTRSHMTRHARVAGRLSLEPVRQRLVRGQDRNRELSARAARALLNRIELRRRSLRSAGQLLSSLSYHGVLSRGFAVVRDQSGAMIRTAAGVKPPQPLEIEFADGRVNAEARSSTAPSEQVSSKTPRKTRGGGPDQESLF